MSTLEQQIDKLLNHRANSKAFYLDVYRLTGSIHASVIYQAIVSVFEYLWEHPDHKKQIRDKDGWFYLKGNYITQRTGIRTDHLSRYVNKLIASNLLEKKVGVNVKNDGKITWYRLKEYIEGGYLSGKDMGIAKGGYRQGGDMGIAKVATSRAGAFLTGKIYKEENKSVAPLRGLMVGSKRTSIPGESKHPIKERPRGVSEREFQYTRLIDEKIRTNRGGKYSSKEIEDRVWNGSVELHKLIKIEGYTFEQVRDVLDWAAMNTFWKANFQSVARLRSKKDRNSDIKFRNMYSAFVLEQEKNAPIEEKIRNVITDELRIQDFDSRTEYEDRIEAHCEDIIEIRNRLDILSNEALQKGKSATNFHNTNQILKMAPFIVWLGDQMYGGVSANTTYSEARDILQPYLKYIEGKLDKVTLGPWLFDEKSPEFHKFLKERGIKYVLRRYRNDC